MAKSAIVLKYTPITFFRKKSVDFGSKRRRFFCRLDACNAQFVLTMDFTCLRISFNPES